jgi:hypothetical protein
VTLCPATFKRELVRFAHSDPGNSTHHSHFPKAKIWDSCFSGDIDQLLGGFARGSYDMPPTASKKRNAVERDTDTGAPSTSGEEESNVVYIG